VTPRLNRRAFLIAAAGLPLLKIRAASQTARREIDLQIVPNARRLKMETVNLGVPLPPGLLTDPQLARVVVDGQEVQSAARPLEAWRYGAGEGSIRSLQLQFDIDLSSGKERQATLQLGEARQRSRPSLVPVESTLVQADGLKGPRAYAVLPADYLCESRVAGPQLPASQSGDYASYDEHVEKQFMGSLGFVASKDATHWLFDRTSTWYKAYVRTGQRKYLDAAYRAAHFVRLQTEAAGPKAGIFKLRGDDLKYVYPQAMHLHYLFTGDPRALETGKTMARYCLDRWDPRYRPDRPSGPDDDSGEHGHWTPRHQGIGMLGVLHGWELSGESVYRDKAREYVDASEAHQKQPPDGRPPDGSWRLNWAAYDPSEAKFEGGASAWMTDILCDALFQYWTIDKDPRVPAMIEAWCDFLDTRGLLPAGAKAYYVINCFAKPGEDGGTVDDSMEMHNAELCHTFALGMFFTRDEAKRAAYSRRVDRLLKEWLTTDLNPPPRAYNWALQSSGQMIYLLQRKPADV